MAEERNEEFDALFQNYLRQCIRLGKLIHEDIKQCMDFIHDLEKNTNFETVILNWQGNSDFVKTAHAFAQTILRWTQDFPEALKGFQELLLNVQTILEKVQGFIIVKNFPTFSISFNEKKFDYEFKTLPHKFKPKSGQVEELKKKEHQIINEMAEIIGFEYQILERLKEIEKEVEREKISQLCNYLLAQKQIKEKFIPELSRLVQFWRSTKNGLIHLQARIFQTVALDEDEFKKLKKLVDETNELGMNQKQVQLASSMLKLAGKAALDFIPYSGVVDTYKNLISGRKLLREAKKESRKARHQETRRMR